MKLQLFLGGAAALLLAGCAHDIRHATVRRNIDLAGGQTPAGSVEFYSAGNDSVIPVYTVDKNGDARLLAAVGLDKGGAYDFDRYQTEVSKSLNVSTPTGAQTFLIDGEGPLIKVPVSEAKATPVEIIYRVIDRGDVFDIYTAETRIHPPTEPAPEPKKKSESKKK